MAPQWNSSLRQTQSEVVAKSIGSFKKGCHYKLAHAEVVAAVESLYEDKIKPNGRILLKRICERAVSATSMGMTGDANAAGDRVHLGESPFIPPKHLRKVCESCTALYVEPEEGCDYSALLVGRPSDFVDPCSPIDPYPASLWNEFVECIGNLSGEQRLLPGGRYACAVELQARDLRCFAYSTLGQICHIVQLAISQKRFLGYSNGNLVPYHMSEMGAKEQCAFFQAPACSSAGSSSSLPFASWEQTRECLREILRSSGSVALPNVKRIFRARFNLDLSETMFGHTRLLELLQDPRLQDVCSLQLHGKPWLVVKPIERMPICRVSLADNCLSTTIQMIGETSSVSTTSGEDLSSPSSDGLDSDGSSDHAGESLDDRSLLEEILAMDGSVCATVKNTFIQIAPPKTDFRPRSQSLPNVHASGMY